MFHIWLAEDSNSVAQPLGQQKRRDLAETLARTYAKIMHSIGLKPYGPSTQIQVRDANNRTVSIHRISDEQSVMSSVCHQIEEQGVIPAVIFVETAVARTLAQGIEQGQIIKERIEKGLCIGCGEKHEPSADKHTENSVLQDVIDRMNSMTKQNIRGN